MFSSFLKKAQTITSFMMGLFPGIHFAKGLDLVMIETGMIEKESRFRLDKQL